MQTSTSSTTPPPSHAQLHTGQLEDYELMLTAMRDVNLHNLIPIRPFSPLHVVREDGFNALWQLVRDSDYMAMCTRLKLQHFDLYVRYQDGNFIYQAWNSDGKRISLALTQFSKWQALKKRIEKAATLLGGAIHSNGFISMERICQFYRLPAWRRLHPHEHPAAISALREKIARHRLRLEYDFEALDLKRPPTEQEQNKLLHNDQVRAEIVDAVNQCLPAGQPLLLQYFANDILSSQSIAQVRATPTVYLEQILQSPVAEKLADTLLDTMGWYGGKAGEQTSPFIRTRLVANAMQYWLCAQIPNNPKLIAGYDIQSRANWGKGYRAIRDEFETHLRASKLAATRNESIVMAQLFLPRFPIEFRVSDIPEDLAYRSSLVWVNFVNGVNFVNTVSPQSLDRLSFQQLVNLPVQRAEVATAQELNILNLTRLPPTMDWAVTLGFIEQKSFKDYTQDDIERACGELEKHSNEVNQAVVRINKAPPQRLSIAKAEIQALLGNNAFDTDGRKLARHDELASIGSRDLPPLRGKGYKYYSFADVLASGMFADQQRWFVTEADGVTLSKQWIRMDGKRYVKTDGPWPLTAANSEGHRRVLSPLAKIADVPALFDNAFRLHLETITAAYQTLIRTLLASLPYADRLALELGEVKVYSLRQETRNVAAKDETPEMTLPLRARNGVILQATQVIESAGDNARRSVTTFYELLPRAGVIRRLENFDAGLLSPRIGAMATTSNGAWVDVIRDRHLPFDWDAHSKGTPPKAKAFCEAIIDQLPPALSASSEVTDDLQRAPLTLSSSRSMAISRHIATELLFVDPQDLRTIAQGQTQFELEEAQRRNIFRTAKVFVPFWGPIEDLISGDKNRTALGLVGVFLDVISFVLPIGKFSAGSIRLVINAGQLTTRATLPSFTTLTKTLLVSTLQTLNPLEIIPALLKGVGKSVLYTYRAVTFRFNELVGKIRYYEYVRSLPQLSDAGRWKPETVADQLASIQGIHDVPVRNIGTAVNTDWRLVDPVSARPYGPSLATGPSDFSPGRSHYSTLESRNQFSVVELTDTRQVREVLEVDGRTTLFLDDVPYRLEGDTLHRADLIDASDSLKPIPCRPGRAPGSDVCMTRYVTRDPAPTPAVGTFDESKGWAPWFGDSIYTPGTAGAPMTRASLATHKTLDATMELRKGMYGQVKVNVTEKGVTDTFHCGAIIAESIDGAKQYVFTRLDAGDFYVTELTKGQSLREPLVLKRASTLPAELRRELMVVYTGSLNANNMVRMYGVSRVERALAAMESIAMPIGGHGNPPETLRLIKVDTSPGEAVLFDHSTRMIVRHSTDGAATWSLSRAAPDSVRETTAEVLNRLFGKTVVTVESSSQGGPKVLKIDNVMLEMEALISRAKGKMSNTPRNVAFAAIKTKTGVHEVYVSVSGSGNNTRFLPLFSASKNRHEVKVGGTSYFNVDHGANVESTSLSVSHSGKIRAIPHTIANIDTYTPQLTLRPTSLDSESKLIRVIRDKYPNSTGLDSITIATTMAPCDSCAVLIKQFGYDGGPEALNVLWK